VLRGHRQAECPRLLRVRTSIFTLILSKQALLPVGSQLINAESVIPITLPLPRSPAPASTGVSELKNAINMGATNAQVQDSVKEYYGEILGATEDLKTSACTTACAPPPLVREALRQVPREVIAKFYGCGSPTPAGIDGLRVLDLGSGSGRDCYVAAKMVGPQGSVVGLDMTPAQLEVARRHADGYCRETLGYPTTNMRFVEGVIEDLQAAGIPDESVDMVISNCVINLSPDKAAVLREVYRVLAPGGEMHFSDVYCDRRLPAGIRAHPVLLGECLGGALYLQDFLRLARAAGFEDPRQLAAPAEIAVNDPELKKLLGSARFYSITFRLFKAPGRLESLCEDYGQAARYKGTVPGSEAAYVLDDHHTFAAGKWYEVCGNTAAMVGESWMARHFDIAGDRSVHYGQFACGPVPVAAAGEAAPLGVGCCG
jgi:arsenite methyltransferase